MSTDALLDRAIAVYDRCVDAGNTVRAARWARIANRYFEALYGRYLP